MCGVRRAFRGDRRADEAVVLAPALGEDEALVVRVVERVLPADPGRPHKVEVGLERSDDLQRRHRFYVEQHDHPGLVERDEEVLAYGEGGVGIDHRHQLGSHDHAPGQAATGDRLAVVRDLEGQLELVEQLHWPGPRLERPGLLAEKRRFPADAAQVDAGPRRAVELDGAPGDLGALPVSVLGVG